MNETSTYQVYTTTPRGAFREVYKGTSLDEALEAYNKLLDADKPRLFNENDRSTMHWGL